MSCYLRSGIFAMCLWYSMSARLQYTPGERTSYIPRALQVFNETNKSLDLLVFQRKIYPFQVSLLTNPSDEVDQTVASISDFQTIVENAISQEVKQQLLGSQRMLATSVNLTISLVYVILSKSLITADGIFNSSEGTVSFKGDEAEGPTESEVNDWVALAVANLLPEALNQQPLPATVVDATYSSAYKSMNGNNDTSVGVNNSQNDVSPSSSNGGMIGGIAVAGVVFLAAFALFVSKKPKKSQVDYSFDERRKDDSHTVNESFDVSPIKQLPERDHQHIEDSKSEVSESSWTVAERFFPFSRSIQSTESFERERCVNLQKDMLTSAWSGRMPSDRSPQMDSVLQPSHFSAAQERRMLQQSTSGDESETRLEFEQVNSSLLTPPSQIQTRISKADIV